MLFSILQYFQNLEIPLLVASLGTLLVTASLSVWLSSLIIDSSSNELLFGLKAILYGVAILTTIILLEALFFQFILAAPAAQFLFYSLNIVTWLLGAFSFFMILKNLFDLSYLKTVFHLILSSLIISLFLGIFGYLLFQYGGAYGRQVIPDFLNSYLQTSNEKEFVTPENSEEKSAEEKPTPKKGPKIPKIPSLQ